MAAYLFFLFSLLWLSAVACQLPVANTATPIVTITPLLTNPPAYISTYTVAVVPTSNTTPVKIETPQGAMTQVKTVNEVQIYLVALEGAGKGGPAVGCGDSLIPVKRPVPPTDQAIQAALKELFAINEQHYGQSGLYNSLWQSNLQVQSARVDQNGTATVVLGGQHQLGGECDIPRFKGQIIQTILAAPGVKNAAVFLNGQSIDQALSLK